MGVMKSVSIPLHVYCCTDPSVTVYSTRFVPRVPFSVLSDPDYRFKGDVADDRFFQKTNDSDATQFSLLYPGTTPHCKVHLHSQDQIHTNSNGISLGGLMDNLPTSFLCRLRCIRD